MSHRLRSHLHVYCLDKQGVKSSRVRDRSVVTLSLHEGNREREIFRIHISLGFICNIYISISLSIVAIQYFLHSIQSSFLVMYLPSFHPSFLSSDFFLKIIFSVVSFLPSSVLPFLPSFLPSFLPFFLSFFQWTLLLS